MNKNQVPSSRAPHAPRAVELSLTEVRKNFGMPLPGEFAVRSGSGNLLFIAPLSRRATQIH